MLDIRFVSLDKDWPDHIQAIALNLLRRHLRLRRQSRVLNRDAAQRAENRLIRTGSNVDVHRRVAHSDLRGRGFIFDLIINFREQPDLIAGDIDRRIFKGNATRHEQRGIAALGLHCQRTGARDAQVAAADINGIR